MGYYTIRISSAIQDIATIVTKFWKFRYNCLTMGVCASGDIFQSKVDKLLGDVEGVKTYINDILVFCKDCFTIHMKQLDIIFGRFGDAGLKGYYLKCSLGLKNIPYLGYLITRESIKPYPKKVQGIMDFR